jgi:hypothetical protein
MYKCQIYWHLLHKFTLFGDINVFLTRKNHQFDDFVKASWIFPWKNYFLGNWTICHFRPRIWLKSSSTTRLEGPKTQINNIDGFFDQKKCRKSADSIVSRRGTEKFDPFEASNSTTLSIFFPKIWFLSLQ